MKMPKTEKQLHPGSDVRGSRDVYASEESGHQKKISQLKDSSRLPKKHAKKE